MNFIYTIIRSAVFILLMFTLIALVALKFIIHLSKPFRNVMEKNMNQLTKTENLNKHLNLIAELYLREIIEEEYPEWVDYKGECKKCDEYYDSLLNAVEVR